MLFPGFHTDRFATPEARAAAAALDKSDRQTMVRTLLYPYPHFLDIRARVTEFHTPVLGGRPDCGKIGGLLGDSRSGKTYVLRSYADTKPRYAGEDGIKVPVAYVGAVADWDDAGLGRTICETIGTAPPNGSTRALQALALRRLMLAGTTLLIIDDAHVMFEATNRRRRLWLGLVKAIADARFCNVLLAGLPFIAAPMEREVQLSGRGAFPRHCIESFTAGSPAELHAYQNFLHGVDERLPFTSPSGLATRFVKELFRYSEGSVGWTMNLVEAAAYAAFNDDAGCIGLDHLKRAAATRPNFRGHVAFAGA